MRHRCSSNTEKKCLECSALKECSSGKEGGTHTHTTTGGGGGGGDYKIKSTGFLVQCVSTEALVTKSKTK